MAKKKKTSGKLLTFTTAVVAISGTCFIFRDKIKQSSIYKTSIEKFSNLFGRFCDKSTDHEEDAFFSDEEDTFDDVFSDDSKQEREYTSITINAKEETDNSKNETEDGSSKNVTEDDGLNKEEEDISTKPENEGYENEGLSDVSEDPEVLEEQDKLDF